MTDFAELVEYCGDLVYERIEPAASEPQGYLL